MTTIVDLIEHLGHHVESGELTVDQAARTLQQRCPDQDISNLFATALILSWRTARQRANRNAVTLADQVLHGRRATPPASQPASIGGAS